MIFKQKSKFSNFITEKKFIIITASIHGKNVRLELWFFPGSTNKKIDCPNILLLSFFSSEKAKKWDWLFCFTKTIFLQSYDQDFISKCQSTACNQEKEFKTQNIGCCSLHRISDGPQLPKSDIGFDFLLMFNLIPLKTLDWFFYFKTSIDTLQLENPLWKLGFWSLHRCCHRPTRPKFNNSSVFPRYSKSISAKTTGWITFINGPTNRFFILEAFRVLHFYQTHFVLSTGWIHQGHNQQFSTRRNCFTQLFANFLSSIGILICPNCQ